eukprot:9058480-Prorocentrum_lima.AAC.1
MGSSPHPAPGAGRCAWAASPVSAALGSSRGSAALQDHEPPCFVFLVLMAPAVQMPLESTQRCCRECRWPPQAVSYTHLRAHETRRHL